MSQISCFGCTFSKRIEQKQAVQEKLGAAISKPQMRWLVPNMSPDEACSLETLPKRRGSFPAQHYHAASGLTGFQSCPVKFDQVMQS